MIITILLCVLSLKLTAQSRDTYTQKILIKAQTYIQKKDYKNAEKTLKLSLRKSKDKEAIHLELGNLYMLTQSFSQAVGQYKMAIQAAPDNYKKYTLLLVDALIKNNEREQAQQYFSRISWHENWTVAKKEEYERLRLQLASNYLLTINSDFNPELKQLPGAINDQQDALFPFISAHDSVLYFTINHGIESHLYYSVLDSLSQEWSSPQPVEDEPMNSVFSEEALIYSYDENYILFSRCNLSSSKGHTDGGCDLVIAYKSSNGWQMIFPFVNRVNSPSFEGMPSLSADNQTLYFVSNRSGGYGGMDIWKTEFDGNSWSVPENLGPEINTEGDEIAPFIAPDGKTLYFSSNKLPGLGGQDMFMSKLEEGKWSTPINLGAPYNSAFDDVGLHISGKENTAYFSSNRPGGKGLNDIYVCKLKPEYMYEPVQYFRGFVTDFASKNLVTDADIQVFDTEHNLVYQQRSNSGNGSYFFVLPYGKRYWAKAKKWDYPEMIFQLENEQFKRNDRILKNFELVHWSTLKKWEEVGLERKSQYEQQKVSTNSTLNNEDEGGEEDEIDMSVYINYRLKLKAAVRPEFKEEEHTVELDLEDPDSTDN